MYICDSALRWLQLCLPLCLASFAHANEQDTLPKFLNTYCVQCHGPDDQSGERRFDEFPTTIQDTNALADYQEVLDQLNLGEMPPADETQPSAKERRAIIALLTDRIAEWNSTRQGHSAHPVLRRMNSREYRNSVRDLFALNMTTFDPTEAFPRDQTVDHLDTIGDALVTSGYLLEQYLAAAEAVVEKAVFPLEQPELQTWKFTDGFKQQPEIDQVHRKTTGFSHIVLYDVVGADKHEGAYGHIAGFSKGVPVDGVYEIRFTATALNRDHPYDDSLIGTSRSEPFRLGIVPGDHTVGPLHVPQPVEPLLTELPLKDGAADYVVKVWLDKGLTPRFTFRNGLMDARYLWGKLMKKHGDMFPKLKRGGIVEHRFNSIKFGKVPQIHVDDITIRGPILDEWPTAPQLAAFGPNAAAILKSQSMSSEEMRRQFQRLMSRAYRRAPTTEEVERVMGVVERQRSAGADDLHAYCDGLKSMLTSPGFLYHPAVSSDSSNSLPLADRLAGFLWSSLPDAELRAAAADKLTGDELKGQVDRLLADERSDAFISGFLDSWLALGELGSQPPERGDFRSYYRFELEDAMRTETRLFTRHLLDENLPVDNFLDSEFAFVNAALAEHYGIEFPGGNGFQQVSLNDERRGGLLGQASVLTVTANGIDTSPVVRGVWVLENLLGTPPNPPPPDVEPLDPDIRGAKTIRDQLKKHRTNPACNDCHRKIDPMGFALENFDPIGRWRTNYGRNKPIDASGELPNGASYRDVTSFRQILLQQRSVFVRGLTKKLLAYGIGRPMGIEDRAEVDQITAKLEQRGGGFRDLIHLCVQSDLFRGVQ